MTTRAFEDFATGRFTKEEVDAEPATLRMDALPLLARTPRGYVRKVKLEGLFGDELER